MLVGDIYGDRDYSNIGLSATTIASSFGKVVSEGKDLEDIDPADIALALCRCASCMHSLTVWFCMLSVTDIYMAIALPHEHQLCLI